MNSCIYVTIVSFCLAVCADGNYHKYSINSKGECHREKFEKFLQMTDD